MQIILNGKSYNISNDITVDDLLRELDLEGRLAVEINKQIIPRSLFGLHKIYPGDKVEIVRAVGGGQN
jgi:sulfur carrier protein